VCSKGTGVLVFDNAWQAVPDLNKTLAQYTLGVRRAAISCMCRCALEFLRRLHSYSGFHSSFLLHSYPRCGLHSYSRC
jgi:hypothetical protein